MWGAFVDSAAVTYRVVSTKHRFSNVFFSSFCYFALLSGILIDLI